MARKLSKNLKKIVEAANSAYPDGLINEFAEGQEIYDGLAEFVVKELKDVYDSKVSLKRNAEVAVQAMDTAIRELEAVRDAIQKLQ